MSNEGNVINRLIVACRDDARAFTRTAAIVVDPSERKRLLEQSRGRRRFVEALSAEVMALGGRPAAYGSIGASLGATFGILKTAITGTHEGEAFADCMRTVKHTERAYARAARARLPDRARGVVEAQSREVSESCVEFTALRDHH